MGAVLSMSELLLTSPLDGTQRRYAETLQQSARSLLTVLNDVLDFSKLEARRFELDCAPFDLHDLVKSVGSALQTQADERTLQSGVHIGMSCPRFVKGDAGRLRQILASLIDNAVKFTAKGSVQLHVNAGENDGQLTLRFDVTDTGAGLGEAEKERLFQPCVQADRAAASQYAGTGLGLSIAQQLVVLMGGEIGCESAPGQGSLFWFTIPTVLAMPTAAKDAPAATLSGHVLVVEDNAPNRMLIGAYLDEFGLTYDMVESGVDALARLATKTYDLVLMDIKMPELDGVETTKRVRKMQGHAAEVPIVALTAHAMKGDREDYLAAGLDGYISKPIRGRDLFAAIAPYLSTDVGEAPLVAVR
jgi:CheY-like chemotaxis protein